MYRGLQSYTGHIQCTVDSGTLVMSRFTTGQLIVDSINALVTSRFLDRSVYSGGQSYTGHVKILGQVSVQWTPVIHWTGQVIVQRTPAGQEYVISNILS